MRYQILTALLLSTAACGTEGIEVRHQGDTLDVLHTALYTEAPGGGIGLEFVMLGDHLRLNGSADPGNNQDPLAVKLTITSIDGPDHGLKSPGPRIGQGLWLTREGIEIGIDAGGEIEIEGQLEWAGPVSESLR